MGKASREPCLTDESCAELLIARKLLRQDFHRDQAAELLVAREIHRRHPAAAELALDSVPPRRERLDHWSPSCFFLWWPLCLPCPCPGSSSFGAGPAGG